jgi:DNA (cytosine-5)-methyltransferase 3A
MNVLSLFDGMACGLVALKRAGIKVDNYFASEINKWAIKIAKKNHPEIIHLGDVQDYQKWELPKIDLILAGPPCQGFSCSGNRLDFNDPRSQLFFKAIEILWDIQKINPGVKFLIENVSSMRKNVRTELDELLQVPSIAIDSNLVSAQNRNRLYWSESPGPQPLDKNIYLRDILEPEVDKKYYLHKTISGKSTLRRLVDSIRFEDEKSKSILTESGFTKMGNTVIARDEQVVTMPNGKRSIKHLVDGMKFDNEKARALTSTGSRNISGSNSTCLIVQRPRGKNDGGLKAIDGKTTSPTGSKWHDNNFLFQHIWKHGDNKTFLKVCRKLGRKPDQVKASCLQVAGKSGGNHSNMDLILYNDMSFRRFTPIECERLQTLPDNYTEGVSNTQRYKMIGNGWTVDIIVHILRNISIL